MRNGFPWTVWLAPLAVGVAVLAVWYAVREATGLESFILPRPDEIVAALGAEWRDLFRSAGQTSWLALSGFLLATIVGGGLSVLMAFVTLVRRALYPWVLVIQMTPVVVLIPPLRVWLDYDAGWVVVVITFLISFFPVVANTTHGLLSTDPARVDLFRLYGASRWQEMWLLRVPGALPGFFVGWRIAATVAVVGAFTAELLAGTASGYPGLGYRVAYYAQRAQMAEVLATAVVACVLGFLFVGTVEAIRHLTLRKWHASARDEPR